MSQDEDRPSEGVSVNGVGSLVAGDDPRVIAALEQYFAALEKGQPLHRQQFLAEHADIAETLAACLDGLEFVHAAGPQMEPANERATTDGSKPLTEGLALGDFRILREVGKGGMGTVYEAEQLSLHRRVAVKVLPFAATMDPRHLQRFHNEAQAAACLHHTNIVPVFFVGCERGVHFYAMQFIDGQPLSEIIRQMQRLETKGPASRGDCTVSYPASAKEAGSTPLPAAERTPLTGEGRRSRAYFRRVAELGIQAAEALDHAHQLGIVHRDIKPANLLLDSVGRLWVTDFGLAHVQHGEAGLTATGQAVGTPRYMSPEQALAKRAPIDHRADVYSLGATLYELLTLRPAFESEDRQELLRQIAFEEPCPPRRHDKAIPAELETIVLKAMAKDPRERYATAGELAEDLRRWLEDRPIRAHRPPLRTRLLRWGRRHRTLVVSAAAALAMGLAVLAGSVGWIVRDQAARQTKRMGDIESALKDAEGFRREGRLPKAQAEAERAEALLGEGGASADLTERVQSLLRELAEDEADQRLVADLAKLRLRQAAIDGKDTSYHLKRSRPEYEQAFRKYGLHWEAMAPQEAATRLQARPRSVRATLVAALDHWLILARYEKAPEADWLDSVLTLADPDSWRHRLRAARTHNDRQALIQLAREVDPATQPPEALYVLYRALWQRGAQADAVAMLRRAQHAHPTDYWINQSLGLALQDVRPPQYEESIRYLTAALALRLDSPVVHFNLGFALWRKGRLDEAAAAFRQALALEKEYPEAHYYLGNFWLIQGRLDEAIAGLRRAGELKPDWRLPHYDLGIALVSKGRLAEAAAAYRRAIEVSPDFAEAYCNLGDALRQQGELAKALAAFEKGHAVGSQRQNWPYPSAQWVQRCQRLVELEGRLPAILRGEIQPTNAAERSEFAELCYAKQHYLAAARFWADAFTADPKLVADVKSDRREDAICAAALAAAGQGKDAGQLASKERSRWRMQALHWLRDELADLSQILGDGKPEDRLFVRRRLRTWRRTYEVASLRDPAEVALLPADEQRECRQLWAEVGSLRKKISPAP